MNIRRLQYISPGSSRNSYTNLGYKPNQNTKIVFDYLDYPAQGVPTRFSALLGATDSYFRFTSFQATKRVKYRTSIIDKGYTHGISGTIEIGNLYLKIDGVVEASGSSAGSFASSANLVLGADSTSGNDSLDDVNTKIGRFCIYEGDTLIAEFIPALDDNNVAGIYNATSDTFLYSDGPADWAAGPFASSINVSYTGGTIASTGGTASLTVDSDYVWTASTSASWVTLSSLTGDTGVTTITATLADNTGDRRSAVIEFINATGDTANITINQKKVAGAGQPVYLGAEECAEMYLGVSGVTEAYLGEDLVFSSGPFAGLKVSPKEITFLDFDLTKDIKVKSSEPWSMTVPSWITASTLTGGTGETIVSLSTTVQSSEYSDTITITSNSYMADVAVGYIFGVPYLDIVGPANIVTDFYPGTFYRSDRYLKIEVAAKANANGSTSMCYLYGTDPFTPWFSMERFTTSTRPYPNMASVTGMFDGPMGGGGKEHPWTIIVDKELAQSIYDGATANTRTVTGSWPADSTPLILFPTSLAANLNVRFYRMKIWDRNGTLIKDFEPWSTGTVKDLVSGTVYSITGSGTATFGYEV